MTKNSINDKVIKNWAVWLRCRVDEFRQMHPNDKRTDAELCESLMDYYVKSGLIKKKNGKYQVSKISYN